MKIHCLLTIGEDRIDSGLNMIASALEDGVHVHVAWRFTPPNHGIKSSSLHEMSIGPASLSVARNILLRSLAENPEVSNADVVCLGDDDGEWSSGSASRIQEVFRGGLPWALGLYTPKNQPPDAKRFPPTPEELTVRQLCDRASSLGIYVTVQTLSKVGSFDERLGVGTSLPIGEDTDYALRLRKQTGRAPYRPQLQQFHAYSAGGRPSYRLVPSLQFLIYQSKRNPILVLSAFSTLLLCLRMGYVPRTQLIKKIGQALCMRHPGSHEK